ncbi:MAG: 4Fe-4S dicluster domain-containing protein, partial [Clostridia bacterium]|nr:4Fe-4S dicluster domain-containing protein [Clostridia bacterium]
DSDYLYLTPNTPAGEQLLESVADVLEEGDQTAVEEITAATKAILEKLPIGDLPLEGFTEENLLTLFGDEQWAKLSQACLGCGTCTFVCPTCQCYDIKDFDTGHGIKRFRCWDSCMYSEFTRCAHGNPRLSQVERFRQRFMHKLVYFPANNQGEFSCVGCGRCVAKCPISMNIVKVIKALGGAK